jgi:hypothetical protein
MSPIGRLLVLGAAVAALGVIGLSCGGGMSLTASVEVNGHVRLMSGAPLAGVRIHYMFPEDPGLGEHDVFTDGAGRYQFWPAEPGPFYEEHNWRHFRMTPSLEGYTFSPMEVDAIAAEEVQTYDFTAVPVSPFRSEYYLIVWSWLESR